MVKEAAVDILPVQNPFTDTDNSLLDPKSPQFNHREWLRAVTAFKACNSEKSSPRVVGVAYRDLSVYGLGKRTDYQRTFGNYPLALLTQLKQWVTRTSDPDVCILTCFDGLVRSGETLLVLGRPGRQALIWFPFYVQS